MINWFRTELGMAEDGTPAVFVVILDRDGGPVARARVEDGKPVQDAALELSWKIQRERGGR